MKPHIDELKSMFQGRPAAILGGGMNLLNDITRLPENTILISVNHYAMIDHEVDAMVFMDHPDKMKLRGLPQLPYLESFRGIKITQHEQYSTHSLKGVEFWDGGFSSSLATWAACYLGADPVILCGMDCYRSKESHYGGHRKEFENTLMSCPLNAHIRAWEPANKYCPNQQRIRVMSGPLVGTFPRYDIRPKRVKIHDVNIGSTRVWRKPC